MSTKRSVRHEVLSFAVTFLIFLILFSFIITCSFLLFFHMIHLSGEQIRAAAPYTFFNILFLTIIFALLDMIRRKLTVQRPIRRIQDMLRRVVNGDFSARIQPQATDHWNEFHEIMQSVNQMAAELSGIETLRTDFIANVSHELKTPLAVMQNYGTMLQQPNLPEAKRQEYGKAITDASRRLADLISNILKLNKLENQQIFPERQTYNLGEQLCGCLLSFENAWEAKNLQIETDIEEDVLVDTDAELLTLVWNNLFSNAIKFTEPNGTIVLTLKTDGDQAVVQVTDTGCGISPAVGQHIFEKFYQGDASHATQGNGLGLALVKRVVDIVEGDISVISAVGEGSTFTVILRRKTNGTA